jgi:DNA-binding transcriptional ArsR family regulator
MDNTVTTTPTVDQRLVKALAHPLRQKILIRLNETVASPKELSQEFGEPVPNVSYHVRTLLDLGAIELVRTTPRRGAVEHHYRALMRPYFSDEDWATLPLSTRRALFDGVLSLIWDDVARGAQAGGFDFEQVHVSRTTLVLDDRGWEELSKVMETTLDRAMQIQARSAGRLVKRGDEGTSSQLVMLHFGNKAPRG